MSKQSELRFKSTIHISEGARKALGGPTTDSSGLVATFPKGHEARVDNDGNLHIYRAKQGAAADTTPDLRKPSKLREALERINQRNRELYERKQP